MLETQRQLRQDLGYLRQAAYTAALIEQTTETETPIPAIFELFNGFLAQLPQQPPQPRSIFAFELKLLCELGLAPDPARANLSGPAKDLLQQLIGSEWADLARLKPTKAQAVEMRSFLHGFLIYHLDKLPAGRSAALTVSD